MLSVIIPAYNEESVILKTLKEYEGLIGDFLELIVVCNGCTDNTEQVVKSYSGKIKVFSISEGSKVKAINLGLKHRSYDCVMVQDADVKIGKESLCEILEFIGKNTFVYASPVPKILIDNSSFGVKAYYDFYMRTPAYNKGMVNSGVYVLSNEGVEGLEYIPNVIADDGYVKFKLGFDKVKVINNAVSEVCAPKNLWSLIKIKTRSRLGNKQLKKEYNAKMGAGNNGVAKLCRLAISKGKYLGFIIYLLITLICDCRASNQYKSKGCVKWERDNSRR